MTHRIIAGGTGFIGQYLISHWLKAGIKITVIGRSQKKIESRYGQTVQAVTWDELPLISRELFRGAELVLNLAGANIAAGRWSIGRKQQILQSRVDTTTQLCELLALMGDKAPTLYNASAIGVYGLAASTAQGQLPPAVDENTYIDFTQHPDFLSAVARQWELATHTSKAHGVYVLNLRFGVVLGRHGGALANLLPSFKLGLGGPIGDGHQAFSWIHIDDLRGIIEFLLQHPEVHGAVNVVAPECVNQRRFAKTLGKVLHRPTLMRTPAWLLRLLFGDMADELLLSGQHVKPTYLTTLGYSFHYPTLLSALTQCIGQQPE